MVFIFFLRFLIFDSEHRFLQILTSLQKVWFSIIQAKTESSAGCVCQVLFSSSAGTAAPAPRNPPAQRREGFAKCQHNNEICRHVRQHSHGLSPGEIQEANCVIFYPSRLKTNQCGTPGKAAAEGFQQHQLARWRYARRVLLHPQRTWHGSRRGVLPCRSRVTLDIIHRHAEFFQKFIWLIT